MPQPLTPDLRIYIAGHRGLVGSALWRHFTAAGFDNLIGWTHAELDLCDANATREAILSAKPDVVIMAAARVGGILANSTQPVEFLNDNLLVQINTFQAAHEADVGRLLFLGSSCIYPKFADQPIREDSLLTGPLEPTNDAYAIAKIAGIMSTQAYRREYGRHWISVMPTNLYGPNDNFDLNSSHVLPALIRKFDDARRTGAESVTLWGTGTPRREFLHVDDMAAGCAFLLDHYDAPEPINLGTGEDLAISELARLVADTVGYEGRIDWDLSKPDGTPRKLLDVSRLRDLGWQARIPLSEGLADTYQWYCAHH